MCAAAPHPRSSASATVHQHEEDDDRENQPRAESNLSCALRRWHWDAVERYAAPLGDTPDEAADARLYSRAVLAAREIRRHVVAADLGRISVRDELLEVIAHFGAHAPILYGKHDE